MKIYISITDKEKVTDEVFNDFVSATRWLNDFEMRVADEEEKEEERALAAEDLEETNQELNEERAGDILEPKELVEDGFIKEE